MSDEKDYPYDWFGDGILRTHKEANEYINSKLEPLKPRLIALIASKKDEKFEIPDLTGKFFWQRISDEMKQGCALCEKENRSYKWDVIFGCSYHDSIAYLRDGFSKIYNRTEEKV